MTTRQEADLVYATFQAMSDRIKELTKEFNAMESQAGRSQETEILMDINAAMCDGLRSAMQAKWELWNQLEDELRAAQ